MGAENPVASRDLHILVYEATEAISSQGPDGRFGARGSAACLRLLTERPVRAMGVVVLEVLLQHCREVARSGDQEVIEAFAAQRSDEALGDRVRARCPDGAADDAAAGVGSACRSRACRMSATTPSATTCSPVTRASVSSPRVARVSRSSSCLDEDPRPSRVSQCRSPLKIS